MNLEDPRFIKSLFEVSHVEFQSYDLLHRHLICSSGLAEKMLGYTSDEFVRLSDDFYKSIVHPDDWHIASDVVKRLMHSKPGEVVDTTLRLRKANGQYLWIYARKLVTERDNEGHPNAITSVIEDVTELISLKERLREKVGQLNAISYVNSHKVRGPVANILGLIDLIEEEDHSNPHNVQVYRYLKEAIHKLDSVIHEINHLSRT